MTTSSRSEVDAGSRNRFSTPLGLSIVAVVAMAVVATAFIVLSNPGPGPGQAGSLEPTQTAEVSPPVTPMPTPGPALTPVPPSVPMPAPISRWNGLTWSDPVTPPFVVHLHDLVAWDDGYVAVGEVDVDAARSEAAFLTSPDGLNWTITEQQDPGIDRYPRHLVALGDELLAFSHRATAAGAAYDGPHVWSSTDGGSTWSLVESPSWEQVWTDARGGPPPEGWDEQQHDVTTGLVDVASGPDGVVAVGNSYAEDRLEPVLLRSTDGRSWSEVGLPADSPSSLLDAVVTFDDGFVLVGSVEAGPRIDTATPAAWYSADGIAWTRSTVNVDATTFPDGAVGIGEMGDVTAGGEGLIGWFGQRAIAVGGPRFTAMWASDDGMTWEQRNLPQIPSDGGVALSHRFVAGDGVRIVALGPAPSLATHPQQWPGLSQASASTDGVEWTSLTLSRVLDDWLERMWVVPDGVIYAGVESFWFGTPTAAP